MNKMVTCQPQEKKILLYNLFKYSNSTIYMVQTTMIFLPKKKKKKKPWFCNRNLSLHMH